MFVLPFYREDDSVNVPAVVIGLILINVFVWIACAALFGKYGFVPAQPHLFTAFTSIFLHIGFCNLAGNMWFLWMFGRRVERSLGPLLFLALYLCSGFGGTLMHYAFNQASPIPCVGSSSAISGVVGCFVVLFPNAKVDLEIYLGWWRVRRIAANTMGVVGAWIVEQTVLGLLTQAGHCTPVSFWGHVGGFVIGLFGSLVLKSTIHGPRVMSKSDLARLDLR